MWYMTDTMSTNDVDLTHGPDNPEGAYPNGILDLVSSTATEESSFLQDADDGGFSRSVRRHVDERREERLSFCGRISYHRDLNGIARAVPHRCGLRICPVCGQSRGEVLKGQILESLKRDFIGMAQVSKDEASLIVAALDGRDSYRRFPVSEDQDVLFFSLSSLPDDFPIPDRNPITEAAVHELDWFTIQNGPDGRNMSGNLGKPAKATSTSNDKVEALAGNFFIDDPDKHSDLLRKIELQVIAATFRLDPRDAEDIQSAISIRDNEYRRLLRSNGLKYTERTIHLSGKLSYVDWVGYTYDSFRDLIALGLCTEADRESLLNSVNSERRDKILAGRHRKRTTRAN